MKLIRLVIDCIKNLPKYFGVTLTKKNRLCILYLNKTNMEYIFTYMVYSNLSSLTISEGDEKYNNLRQREMNSIENITSDNGDKINIKNQIN
jgi:hypothetical protein